MNLQLAVAAIDLEALQVFFKSLNHFAATSSVDDVPIIGALGVV